MRNVFYNSDQYRSLTTELVTPLGSIIVNQQRFQFSAIKNENVNISVFAFRYGPLRLHVEDRTLTYNGLV